MAAASMVAVLAEVAGAAVDGAAVGVELAGEVVVGGGVDRPSGLWASASVWDLCRLGRRLGSGVGRRRPVCALAASLDWLGLARGARERLLVRQ
jgi:hypothetical protein